MNTTTSSGISFVFNANAAVFVPAHMKPVENAGNRTTFNVNAAVFVPAAKKVDRVRFNAGATEFVPTWKKAEMERDYARALKAFREIGLPEDGGSIDGAADFSVVFDVVAKALGLRQPAEAA